MTVLEKFKASMLGPTIILLSICGVVTLALAAVYQVTLPIIKAGELEAANTARRSVLETADSFTLLEFDYPEGVSEVHKADNDTGYVVRSSANGYGGAVTFIIGFKDNGEVAKIEMFDHNETPGLGSKIGNDSYLSKYQGDVDPYSVDAVTGATRTSNALKNAVAQAKEAYELAKEAA